MSDLRAEPTADRLRGNRSLRLLVGVAAAVVACAGLKASADIVAPTFLALTLVITVHPLQRWMVARRVPRALAAAICLVVLYVTVIGLVTAMALSISQLIAVMPTYEAQFVQLYRESLAQLARLGLGSDQLQRVLDGFNVGSLFSALQSFLSSLLGATSLFVILLTVLLFLIFDSVDMPRRLTLAARANPAFVAALESFAVGIRRYWVVTAVFGLIVAVLDVVALMFLGIPLALLWGLVSFITNFIPNIGFILGLVPPALLGLLEGGVTTMLWVVVVYSVLNFVVQTVIQPRFTGDAVGVTTAVSFLSLTFWAFILGPLGALLALPATLFVKTMLVDGDPRNRWVNTLIASNPR
ncbi:AI-2E family transporter [Auraticoccus sp. F435]|uniref:AI-2E family transporter n=1 Tax=Auraticoccus cholistanensis TaxID=2656650 RepID=A0A6A9UVP6_9ACTN|nr:AI-2E family transporter [Auraticoccus cholistanensis]MVA75277.1 AI-2E family transporter [Auraticoccus cholistanensis]